MADCRSSWQTLHIRTATTGAEQSMSKQSSNLNKLFYFLACKALDRTNSGHRVERKKNNNKNKLLLVPNRKGKYN